MSQDTDINNSEQPQKNDDAPKEKVCMNALKKLSTAELTKIADSLQVKALSRSNRSSNLVSGILVAYSKQNKEVVVEGGVLEVLENYGFLRFPERSYMACPDDVYVSISQIKRFRLRTGDMISGKVRAPREGEKYFALQQVEKINGKSPEDAVRVIDMESLTPIFPDKRIKLELGSGSNSDISNRIIDLVSPIGFGQRALVVSPPKAGKTMMLQSIATSIALNHPEAKLIVLLIDERPEEVTEMMRGVRGEVVDSICVI